MKQEYKKYRNQQKKEWEHSGQERIRKYLPFPNSGHFPLEKISKVQFEFLARKGSLEAFFALCSQYVLQSSLKETRPLRGFSRLLRKYSYRITLSFLSLFFWNSLFFLSFFSRNSLFFLSVFPFFSRDFRGSVGIKNPCVLVVFPAFFPQKTRKGRTGYWFCITSFEKPPTGPSQERKRGHHEKCLFNL